jgi:hypothetical protein
MNGFVNSPKEGEWHAQRDRCRKVGKPVNPKFTGAQVIYLPLVIYASKYSDLPTRN